MNFVGNFELADFLKNERNEEEMKWYGGDMKEIITKVLHSDKFVYAWSRWTMYYDSHEGRNSTGVP